MAVISEFLNHRITIEETTPMALASSDGNAAASFGAQRPFLIARTFRVRSEGMRDAGWGLWEKLKTNVALELPVPGEGASIPVVVSSASAVIDGFKMDVTISLEETKGRGLPA